MMSGFENEIPHSQNEFSSESIINFELDNDLLITGSGSDCRTVCGASTCFVSAYPDHFGNRGILGRLCSDKE